MSLTIDSKATLHNGTEMPWLGLGVFRAEEGGQVEQAIPWAAALGYRSIDTAAVYGNEAGVAEGIRRSGIPREEYFLTTKVWNSEQGYETTLRAFDASLKRLSTDYVDLYLIHWPVKGKYRDTWRALERIYREGRSRAIGVSNFLVHHLENLLPGCEVAPMVNQVEFHPWLLQPELLSYCAEYHVQVEAWSPVMRGKVQEIPELVEIGKRHHKSPFQVVLRWDLQHAVVTIPKSVQRERIRDNADIFDFELTDEEMTRIDGLDRGKRMGPHPDHITF